MIQPSGTCSPLFSATISFPSATVDVVMSRIDGIAAVERDADRNRIGRQPAIAAAERRDALRARRVEEVQRHLACGGGHLRPIADAPEMPAVAQTDHREPALRGLGDAELRCEFTDHLPEAAVAVDDRDRVGLERDRRRRDWAAASLRAPIRDTCRRECTPCESCPTQFASTSRRAIVAASSALLPARCIVAVTRAMSFAGSSARIGVVRRLFWGRRC